MTATSGAALEVRGLRFAYGRRELWRDVNFEIPAGAVAAILGNNGIGKSTLLNCIGGILTPSGGRVFLQGCDLLALPRRERARRVAYVAQHFETSGASVYDTVLLGRLPYFFTGPTAQDHAIVERVLHELGIAAWRDRSAKTLSGGEAQKVMLARAMAQQTDVLLLDEPTASLDIGNQVSTLSYVSQHARKHQTVVLMVSHDINSALRFCSHFLLIDPAGAVESVPAGALTEAQLSKAYGVDVRLFEMQGQRFALVQHDPSLASEGTHP